MFKSGDKVASKKRVPIFDAGRHHRARLGFILLSTDPSAESDFNNMAPEGVAVYATRLETDDHTTNATLARHIEHMANAAARLQPEGKPDVISYVCTSGSIVIGIDRVLAEIKKGAPWAVPTCIAQAVLDALCALAVKKLVVGTPYLDEINTAEAEFLTAHGFDVLDIQGLNIASGWDMGLVSPQYLRDFAIEIDQPEADAIFLSCSGLRALDVVEDIEQATGKPVITSNQAQFWSALRRAGITDEIQGFGQIFRHKGASLLPK